MESPQIDSEADWNRLATAASQEGLLPLLMYAPPPEIANLMARATALRALVDHRHALQATAARTFVSIYGEGVFYKGWDLRHRLYSLPQLRPSADLDVLVRRSKVSGVRKALTTAGHPQVRSASGTVWAPFYYELGFDIGEVRVEVHRSAFQPVRATVDYDEIHAARESFVADGVTYYRPSALHATVLHALALAKDEMAVPMIRFVDFWLMLRRWPDQIGPAIDLARRWSLRRALYASAHLTGILFGGIPSLAQIESELVTRRERTFLNSKVLPDRTRMASGHNDGRAAQVWRKFWLMDNVRRRVAFAGFHVLTVAAAAVTEALSRGAVERYRREKAAGLGAQGAGKTRK